MEAGVTSCNIMTTKRSIISILLLGVWAIPSLAPALDNVGFAYQGRLVDGASPATGVYDLRFTLYDDATMGAGVGGPLTNSAIAVSNGLFTVVLDFGASVFTGAGRWLEIGVRNSRLPSRRCRSSWLACRTRSRMYPPTRK